MSRQDGEGQPPREVGTTSGETRFSKAWRDRIFNRENITFAIQIGVIAFLTYIVGTNFTSLFHGASATLGAIWCAITAIAVLEPDKGKMWKEGIRQLVGTFVGVIVAALFLTFLPFSVVGMGICVAVTVLLCQVFGIGDATKLAATGVVMIMVVSYGNPDINPWLNSALRFAEACIGVAISVVVAAITPWGAARKS